MWRSHGRGFRASDRGFIVYPRYFAQSRAADPATRAAMQLDTFLWPRAWALTRELNRGDVLTYDESIQFLGELWSHDLDAEARFVSRFRPTCTWPACARAKWCAHRTPHEQALRAAGAELLFMTPLSATAMYRMPR